MKSPIEDAYHTAVSNRLLSLVYVALNEGVPPEDRRSFRKTWSERGTYFLAELLLHCASEDRDIYPGAFWVNPWIARHLRRYDAANFCYILEQWLEDRPLPTNVSDDPRVEDEKVQKLAKLFSALNR